MERSHAIAIMVGFVVALAGVAALLISVSLNSPEQVQNRDESKVIQDYLR